MSRPLVSIGMPVRNSNRAYFDQALKSVLEQDLADFELIMSDNCSRDEIANVYRAAAATDPRIRYIRQTEELGAGDNFRAVLREARGEFFFWAADDDVRAMSFARETVELLQQTPNAALAGCQVAFINENDERVAEASFHPDTNHPSVTRRVAALGHPAFYMDIYGTYRTAALRALDGIRWNAWGADNLIVFDMLLRGPIPRVPKQLFRYRVKTYPDGASLAKYLIEEGAGDKDPRLHWEAERSRDLRTAVLNANLKPLEKLACLGRVSLMTRRSPFVDERRRMARFRYTRALRQGSYVSALRAAAAYAFLSPTAICRPSAWRGAFRALKAPSQ
jgi:glycosyltransferase involved in cell wall biosynthesis